MFQRHTRLKVILIPIVAIAVIVGAAYGVLLYDKKTLPSRLTASVRDYAINKDPFQETKLIEVDQEGPINLNGDSSMNGVFQLSKSETLTLLASDKLIKCPHEKKCEVEKAYYTSSDRTYYCTSGNLEGEDEMYTLCVDAKKNQAQWSYVWY